MIDSCTYHPAPRGLQADRSVAVHGGLKELAGPQIPEQHETHASPYSQDIALERHRSDSTPRVTGRNFSHGLKLFTTLRLIEGEVHN